MDNTGFQAKSTLDVKKFFINGCPVDPYSLKDKPEVVLDLWNRNFENIIDLFGSPDGASLTLPAVLCILIDRSFHEPSFVSENAERLTRVLPLLFKHPKVLNFVSSTTQYDDTDFIGKQRRLIKKMKKQEEILSCLLGYIMYCKNQIKRSTESTDKRTDREYIFYNYPDFDSKKDATELAKQKLSAFYSRYTAQLSLYGLKEVYTHNVLTSAKGMLYEIPAIYPVLPPALALLEAKSVSLPKSLPGSRSKDSPKRKLNKENVFEPLEPWEMPRAFYDNTVIYKQGLISVKDLREMIYRELLDTYAPVESILPKAKYLFGDPNYPWQPPRLLTKNDIFVMPICKYRSLAMSIAKSYSFGDSQTALLVEKMPEYLYSAKLQVKEIQNAFGKQALEVIRVYRSLVQSDCYNMKGKPSFQEELKKNTMFCAIWGLSIKSPFLPAVM